MPGETPPEVSEDCLCLNIWTSAKSVHERPVVVWIHGGGYINGRLRCLCIGATAYR